MADLSGADAPRAISQGDMNGAAGNITLVTLAPWCRYLTVQFFESDGDTDTHGWILEAGADGAAKGDDFLKVRSGETFTNYPIMDGGSRSGEGLNQIRLACGAAGGKAQILQQRDAS